MLKDRTCPHCGSKDLARYVRSGMGYAPKSTRTKIDTGCLDNGYTHHCWNCELDLWNLHDDPVVSGEPDIARIDDIFMTK